MACHLFYTDLLPVETLGTNFSEILLKIETFVEENVYENVAVGGTYGACDLAVIAGATVLDTCGLFY